MTLFPSGMFTAHSGALLPWKIECDALTDEDLFTLAGVASRVLPEFNGVYGVPRGGVRFANAMLRHRTPSYAAPLLIVDDVLTTGRSMEAAKARLGGTERTLGLVMFARGTCPPWVRTLFALNQVAW